MPQLEVIRADEANEHFGRGRGLMQTYNILAFWFASQKNSVSGLDDGSINQFRSAVAKQNAIDQRGVPSEVQHGAGPIERNGFRLSQREQAGKAGYSQEACNGFGLVERRRARAYRPGFNRLRLRLRILAPIPGKRTACV